MKLTKGKISKLYNKKKQSFKKKINKKRSASKRKTFRKNKNFNLAKKTLKRFYGKKRGGKEPNEDPKVLEEEPITSTPPAPVVTEEVVAPAVTEEVVTPAVTEEVVTPAVTEEVVAPGPTSDIPAVTEEVVTPGPTSDAPAVTEEVVTPAVTGEDVPVTNVDVNDLPNTSAATEELSSPGSADVTKEETIAPASTNETVAPTGEDVPVTKVDVNDLPSTSAATEGLSEPSPPPTFEPTSDVQDATNISGSEEQQGQAVSEESAQVEENTDTGASVKSEEETGASSSSPQPEQMETSSSSQPEQMETSSSPQSTNDKLTQALGTIVEVLSEKVAAKVANEVGSGSSGERVQDGFDSVAVAAEKMSGGKKIFINFPTLKKRIK
jgi:hypothetical protein